ncbi:AAA+ family ATPase [Phaeovulum sp. NW3]|uniref:AAA+ family ATPase n=1 Tax=Phaeovulum sp. NW3 TaxID=2934933 RepID=UPI002020FBBF|nr:AAA+ family ATPase [Phaeovulum sp. NW3]MCL7465002.1 AAA+ family ATPase [Phaeovulum sp. NW3]
MKHLAMILAVALAVAPAGAQTPDPAPESEVEEGFSLLEEGAKLLLRGLMGEIGPALEDMQRSLEDAGAELGPLLAEMMRLIDDLQHYQVPERLPNGDIIIRRKPDAPAPPADGANPEIEI